MRKNKPPAYSVIDHVMRTKMVFGWVPGIAWKSYRMAGKNKFCMWVSHLKYFTGFTYNITTNIVLMMIVLKIKEYK